MAPTPSDQAATLIAPWENNRMQYWLIFHDFYVIINHTRSVKYVMAVYQLARKIAVARR